MERLEFDLLFRWFVGLGVDDSVWDATVFSKNRDRLLIAALFAAGAVQKLVDPAPVVGLLAGRGLPGFLVWPALAFNAVGAAALILGVATRSMAAALALYCMATSVFHLIPSDPWQMSIFVKNWAIAGGLLVLAAHGPARFALKRSGACTVVASERESGQKRLAGERLHEDR